MLGTDNMDITDVRDWHLEMAAECRDSDEKNIRDMHLEMAKVLEIRLDKD